MWQPEKCPALHKIPPMTVNELIAVLQTLPGSTYVRDVDDALMCHAGQNVSSIRVRSEDMRDKTFTVTYHLDVNDTRDAFPECTIRFNVQADTMEEGIRLGRRGVVEITKRSAILRFVCRRV
jgi:hypothetical protein